MEALPRAETQELNIPGTNDFLSLAVFEVDPYKHLDYLGHGAYGYVDKVTIKGNSVPSISDKVPDPSTVYARKVVRISSSQDREYLRRSVLNEFKILNRLNHRHIVKVSHIYQWKSCLSIIMNQVADSNLSEYLQSTDEISEGQEKQNRRLPILSWPLCLVQAVDYLHEMKVKHKDLKPANILIKDGRVLIADFGISKDIIDTETTASLGASGDVGTIIYCAPEVLAEGQRRGRAADIYALGCVFLEIATVLLLPEGGLRKWSLHKEKGGSRLYSKSCPQILQWISHLTAFVASAMIVQTGEREAYIYYHMMPIFLSFLMLDPNPKTRITARQMVYFLRTYSDRENLEVIKFSSCSQCVPLPDLSPRNLPWHSTFNLLGMFPDPDPGERLDTEIAPNWEAAKRLWLDSHMWW